MNRFVVKVSIQYHACSLVVPVLAVVGCSDVSTEPAPALSIKEGAIALEAPARDMAYDSKRNVLYLAEPSFSQIGVLSLASLQFGTPIATGRSRPTGLDLSISLDSLIVSLPEANAIGIINLTTATPSVDSVKLTIDNFLNRRPDILRVMPGDRVIMALTFDGSGFGGQVLEYNLRTRAQRLRTDVGFNQSVTELTRLARSGDRQRLLLLIDDSCCPLSGFVYNAQTDQWSTSGSTVNRYFPTVSSNTDGSRYLIAASLFSGTLTLLQTFSPSGYDSGPTALGVDGTTAFLGTSNGVLQVNVADGRIVRTLPTIGAPTQIFVLPTGAALIALTATNVHVFRLT